LEGRALGKQLPIGRSKAYPDFLLTSHPSGAWQKKIRGRTHYFGKWARRVNGKLELVPGDGWEEALALYKAQADDLHTGRTPRSRRPDDGRALPRAHRRHRLRTVVDHVRD
jgi:hypothetical protein